MKFIKFTILIFFSAFIISCNKSNDNATSGDAVLKFTISDEPLPFIQNARYSANDHIINSTGEMLQESKSMSDGMMLDSYTEEIDLSKQNPLASTNNFFSQNGEKIGNPTSKNMANGVKYRILLYYKKDKKFAASAEATAGQELLIPVFKNEEYLWYAYSYNNSNSIPEPSNTDDPTIETPTQMELLYDSGTASSPGGNTPFTIRFKHQLTKVTIEFDVQNWYGKITESKANVHFSQNNYINQGTFAIRTGSISEIKNANVTKMYNFKNDKNHPYVTRTNYYTADPQHLTSIKIRIDQIFLIKDIGGTEITLFPVPVHVEFKGYQPARGKQLLARMRLWKKNVRKLTILHAQGRRMNITNVLDGGHAAGAGASYNMIHNPANFGTQSESKVKVDGFKSVHAYSSDEISTLISREKPDIVIVGEQYDLSPSDITSLENFVKNKGVLLLFSDMIYTNFTSYRSLVQKFTSISGWSNTTAGISYQGEVFPINNINDEITNGVFGSTIGQKWGSDLSRTQFAKTSANNMTKYSSDHRGTFMFKLNDKHLFFCGDGGFLANPSEQGEPNHGSETKTSYTHAGHLPFATSQDRKPTTYFYGKINKGNVYNSIFFGNLMQWAVNKSLNDGINPN